MLSFLPPSWGTKRVSIYLEALHGIALLSLQEQLAAFRRKEPLAPRRAQRASDRLVYMLIGSDILSAHYSTVLHCREVDGREWVRYQPEPYKVWKVNPKTHAPYVAEVVEPPERDQVQMELGIDNLINLR